MTFLELTVPFGLGVVSSLHCAQMCGPIVLSFSLGGANPLAAHLLYNAGRIATYATLGALAGAAGHRIALWGAPASIAAGALMMVAAFFVAGRLTAPALVQIAPVRAAGALLRSPAPAGKLGLGALLGLLPCGMVYAALLQAVGTGSAAAGAASMFAFGLGTAGMLLAIGLFSSALRLRFGLWSHRLAGICIFATGAFLMYRGFTMKAVEHACHG